MKNEQNDLERLKGKNPFTVPEGYWEGLTEQVMDRLPDKPVRQATSVSFMDRVRPWLYMAAVFAGLGLFFKGITHVLPSAEEKTNALLVKTEVSLDSLDVVTEETEEEGEDEYLQYIEDQYTQYLLAEELALGE